MPKFGREKRSKDKANLLQQWRASLASICKCLALPQQRQQVNWTLKSQVLGNTLHPIIHRAHGELAGIWLRKWDADVLKIEALELL